MEHSSATNNSIVAMFRAVLVVAVFSLFLPSITLAAQLAVAPAVIDGKGKAREMLRYTITIDNKTDRLVSLYPWVTDVDAAVGQMPISDAKGPNEKDIKSSLARWIEITRGVINLLPGDSTEIPVLIQINLNAAPGLYHAIIHFSDGTTRKEAEENAAGTKDVLVNIEVLEDKNVRLQLGGFSVDRNLFVGREASFSYSVENIGNRGVSPGGKIRIFDRKGEEIAAIEANNAGKKIEPNEKALLASVWNASGEFGKYKAMLDLEYGDRGAIQDTVFFWILPWGRLLSYFTTLFILTVVVALLIHSRMASVPKRAFQGAHSALEQRIHSRNESSARSSASEHRGEHHARSARAPARLPPPMKHAPTSAHRVTLFTRPKRPVDPAHIINLKKR